MSGGMIRGESVEPVVENLMLIFETRSLQVYGLPNVTQSKQTSWTNESVTYQFILDESDCGDINRRTIFGDMDTVYGRRIENAAFHDFLSNDWDIAHLNEDKPENLTEAKLDWLLKNAQAADSEISKLLDDPKVPGDGHDELRHLLFTNQDLKNSLLQKTMFIIYVVPQVGFSFVIGAIIAWAAGNSNLVYTNTTDPIPNTLVGGTHVTVNAYQCGAIVAGSVVIAAIVGRLIDSLVRARGGNAPPDFFTDDEYIAMAAAIAWLRKTVRQLSGRVANRPVAEVGLAAMDALGRPPVQVGQGINALADEGQLEQVVAHRAGDGNAGNC